MVLVLTASLTLQPILLEFRARQLTQVPEICLLVKSQLILRVSMWIRELVGRVLQVTRILGICLLVMIVLTLRESMWIRELVGRVLQVTRIL